MTELAAALARAGVRDVDDSALAKSLYASDASLYRIPPQAVVRPRDEAEIVATLAVAREQRVPLTMRGAGTSIAGNAIGAGIVLDTSKYYNSVLEITPEQSTARVQPGVVHRQLQQAAAPHGLRFGPDPSTHTRCTIGGMIGNNACGSRALGYGRTADNVESLKVLLADGSIVDTSQGTAALDPLDSLIDGQLELVRTEFGRFGRQVSGYSFEHLLPENGRRFDRFMVGTEGTLGVVLEATMRLVKDAPYRALAVLGYASMAEAADAVPALLVHDLVACEGLDDRIARLVSPHPELPAGAGWLFAEVTGDTETEARSAAEAVIATAGVPARVVSDAAEQAALWRIREDGAGLAAKTLDRQAQAGWEDAAVPPEQLGKYLRDFDLLLADHQLHGVPFGHFGDGCMHVRIDFELGSQSGRDQYRAFVEEAAELVASYGGSMSGEHGDGRARSELLAKMYSADALALMKKAKGLLDPDNLLNPGVVVDPDPLDADIKLAGVDCSPQAGVRTALRLADDDGSFAQAVHRCTGVGKCLADNTATGGVMCPSYLASRDEKDSTRGRAHVLQEVARGALSPTDDAVADALDLCLSCKGCSRDCPTGVDMASYKSEMLHQRYQGKIRPASHYALGRLPQLAKLAPPKLANWMMSNSMLARAMKSGAGVDQRRGLPSFSKVRLRKQIGAPVADVQPDVWIWADSFTDAFAAEGGLAALDLLESLGLKVGLIPEAACCGLTLISTGQLDAARKTISATVSVLHHYASTGTPIIGLEPSCLAALREDAGQLVDDPRTVELAASMKTLAEFLVSQDYQPPSLAGKTLVVQPHCHQHAVLGFDADLKILKATGAEIRRLGGCCGLAGNFGVEKGHYETSVAVAEQSLLPAIREAGPEAVVVADGFSCRTQVDDLSDAQAVTLAQLLYGAADA